MKLTIESARAITTLLEELELHFPNNIPINNTPSLEDFRKLQGQQEVIQFVRNAIDDGEDDESS